MVATAASGALPEGRDQHDLRDDQPVRPATVKIPTGFIRTAGRPRLNRDEGPGGVGRHPTPPRSGTIAANLIGSIEAVHFQVGNTIRQAGGHNAVYAGIELKYGW